MNKFYVSHCPRDKVVATELMALAEPRGHEAVFLPYWPGDGVPDDRDFERDVHALFAQSAAVVVLCSAASMASRWVAAEIAYARAAGMALFPVQIEPCELDPALLDRDVVDLGADRGNAWQQLWMALRFSGLGGPELFDWEPGRPPWPGTQGYGEDDAAVFFGRDDDVHRALGALYRMQRTGDCTLLVLCGPDGCGKSSLVQAGLMPRLLRDSVRWIVMDPLDLSGDLFEALASCITRVFKRYGEPLDQPSLAEGLRSAAMHEDTREAARMARRLAGQLSDKLRRVAGRMEATPLLLCPGLGGLLRRSDAESGRFVALLRTLLQAPERPLAAIATLDSDHLDALYEHRALQGLQSTLVPVRPLTEAQLERSITGPAEVAQLVLETGLVRWLQAAAMRVPDPKTRQAVLAGALRGLWDKHGHEGYLADEQLPPLQRLFERAALTVAAPQQVAGAPPAAATQLPPARPVLPPADAVDTAPPPMTAPAAPTFTVAPPPAPPPIEVVEVPPEPELPPIPVSALEPELPDERHAEPIAATETATETATAIDAAPPPPIPPAAAPPPKPLDLAVPHARKTSGKRLRALAVSTALLGVIVAVGWHVGHHAHHGIRHAHKAVTHSHDDIVPAHTRHAAHKARAAAAVAVDADEEGTSAATPAAATPAVAEPDEETADAAPAPAVATPVAAAEAPEPPARASPASGTATVPADPPGEQAPVAPSAHGSADAIATILRRDAPLTGLLMLTALDPGTYPRDGLRAALQVDNQQLPQAESLLWDTPVLRVRFSADGRRVVACSKQGVAVTRARDGEVIARWPGSGIVDAWLSPRGEGLLTLRDDGKAAWRKVDGGATLELGAVRPPLPGRGWGHVVFTDDGKHALVQAQNTLARLTLDGSTPPREELAEAGKIHHVLQTPTGPRVVTTLGHVLRIHKWVGGKLVARFIDRIQYSQTDRVFLAAQMSADGKMLVTADVGPDRLAGRRKVGITVWHRKANGFWWNVRAKFLRRNSDEVVKAKVAIHREGATAIAAILRPAKGPGEPAQHQSWFFSRQDWRRSHGSEHRIDVAPGAAGLLVRAVDDQATWHSFEGKQRPLGGAATTALGFATADDQLVTGHADGAVRVWGPMRPTTTTLGWQPPRAIKPSTEPAQVSLARTTPGGALQVIDGPLAGSLLADAPAGATSVRVLATAKRALHVGDKRLHLWRTDKPWPPMVAPLPRCTAALKVALTADGRHVIAACNGAPRALLVDWKTILERLRTKTRSCLSPSARRQLLGESAERAKARHEACQRR